MEKKVILVSGAAGVLGADLISLLLAKGHTVIAMVHNNSEVVTNSGLLIETSAYQRSTLMSGVGYTIKVDLTRDKFDLSEADYQSLKGVVDLVVHTAAITEFGFKDELYENVNVNGTANILKFVSGHEGNKIPLVHVSTAYVCGNRVGNVMETDLNLGQSFTNAYERSKHTAENLVQKEKERGLPVVTLRPSIVVGDSVIGQTREFRNIYTVLKLSGDGSVTTMPGNYTATFDLVPVDYTVKGALLAVEKFDQFVGETIHLVAKRPVSLLEISEVMSEYPFFRVPRFIPPRNFNPEKLSPKERRYHKKVIQHYSSYFTKRIDFDYRNAERLFNDQPMEFASGKKFLRQIFDYCEQVKFIGGLRMKA